MIKIELKNRIPSKKNSKIIVCRGTRPMLLPSSKYMEWHKDASLQLVQQKIPKDKISGFSVTVQFYVPDLRKADSSNKFESIMDLLVDNDIIEDDNWWVVNDIHINKVILDRENPRCYINLEYTD